MSIYDDVLALQQEMEQAKADISAMQPLELAENTDLNNLTAAGMYVIPSEAISGTLANKPVTGSATGFIQVVAGGADGQVTMFFHTCSKSYPLCYQRAYYGNGWGDWLKTDILDSGWKPLPLTSGITAHNAASFPCRYRRTGNMVFIQGCVTGFADVEKVVATIPEGYRPSSSFYSLQATQGGNTDTFNVRTNGEIRRMSTTMPVASLSSTNYHFINFSYLID